MERSTASQAAPARERTPIQHAHGRVGGSIKMFRFVFDTIVFCLSYRTRTGHHIRGWDAHGRGGKKRRGRGVPTAFLLFLSHRGRQGEASAI